ncbi:hypothetical protein [Aliamphritea spongicola]|nr:hypothetical protein [Aliamphritea spongicola]
MAQLSKWYSKDRVVEQLHWGGGTPTFISNEQMTELMQALRDNFNLLDDDSGDYSIEIDPAKWITKPFRYYVTSVLTV